MEPKFKLYNEQGRVEDPEVARKMAEAEAPYHKKRLGIFRASEKSIKKGDEQAALVGEKIAQEKEAEMQSVSMQKQENEEILPPVQEKKEVELSAWELEKIEESRRVLEIMNNPTQYIDEIKINGKEAVLKLIERESLGSDYEGLLTNLIDIDNAEVAPKAPELIEAIAEVWSEDQKSDMPHWVHSVCHIFEKYGQSGGDNDGEVYPSLLNDKRWNKATEILVKAVISRAADVEKYPLRDKANRLNLRRILEPLMMHNLDAVSIDNLEKFPLKPEHSDYDAVAEQKSADGSELNIAIKEFLHASSPKELVLRLVNVGEPLPTSDLAKAMELLETVKNDVEPDQMNAYLAKAYPVNDQVTDIETMKKNIAVAKEASEKLEGLFVDVDGTLIMRGDRININIIRAMEDAVKRGTTVTVFTGGSPEVAAEKLRSLGVPEQFLDVKSKAEFSGKELDWIIDDTRPELQGFISNNWELPSRAIYKME